MEIVRGVTFRGYDLPVDCKSPEVAVEAGVISHNMPDEMTSVEQVRAYGEALLRAAEELRVQQVKAAAEGGGA